MIWNGQETPNISARKLAKSYGSSEGWWFLIENNLFQCRLHTAWIITNNLLYKIDHHSKNHTSSLDQKSVMAKKTLDQVQSVWLRLYWPRIPDPWGIIAPHHSSSSALTAPYCPNFRPQGVDDPFYDSRSLGSAIQFNSVEFEVRKDSSCV